MGLTIALLGGVIGFFTALVGWVFFDFSLLLALAIWGASGPLSLVLLLLRREDAELRAPDGHRA